MATTCRETSPYVELGVAFDGATVLVHLVAEYAREPGELCLCASEKLEMAGIIVRFMKELASDVDTQRRAFLRQWTDVGFDIGDFDFATYQATQFNSQMYVLTRLCDPATAPSACNCFWAEDTGPREFIWQQMRDGLSPKLLHKIDACLDFYN